MERSKIALIVATLAVGAVGGVYTFGGSTDDASITSDARATAATAYDNAPSHTDLLSPPVAAGDVVATGVTLPAGASVAGVVLTGAALGSFDVVDVTATPTDDGTGTWLSVTARNRGSSAMRFTADVGYAEPAP